MPRIRLPAHIIHAPQASRTGGRRTLRHHMKAWTTGGQLGVGQAKLPTKEDDMTRRTWTPRRKLAVFETHKGRCHLCQGKIDGTRESWELEHIIPLAMGGADDETNVAPAHVACHRTKTTKDSRQIAKANRVRAKHNGAARPKSALPGSKASRWKRKISGETVRRDE